MHKRILYASAASAALLAGCQAAKPAATASMMAPAAGPAVEMLGTYPVPANEFAYVYRKNNSAAADYGTRPSVTDYLDLYTNFRLKVLEAEQRGLDTTQAFKRELDGYRQQLAQPYLTEKSVTDQLVREAYDRMGQEVSASHILIRVAPDAAPADTLAAYNKIVALRQQAVAGTDFGQLASTSSEDPLARENGGKLGYFTAMQMVYPFESAAYKTPVGQISAPIRTRFGYHVIKVNDKRTAQGEIKVAHLMIRMNPGAAKADSLTARKKIDELYSRLKKGESWDKLVAQFSEDAGSAANGGELPPFGTGRMIPSFEEAAFKLQKPGDLTPPVQTPYGWHVIKLIEKQPLAKFADLEAGLKSKVSKDSRSELNKAAFLKRVRREDQFVEIPAAKAYTFDRADTALVAGRFKYQFVTGEGLKPTQTKASGGKMPLFLIKNKPYYVSDFLTYVQQNQRARPGAQPAFAMQQLYDQYVEQSLTEFEKGSLDTKYEDYRMLVKEYRDGILLFQLMDEKVWSKAIEDTVGLKKYFADNQAKYQWDQRVQGRVISAATPAVLTRVQKELKTGRFPMANPGAKSLLFNAGKADLSKAGEAALDDLAKRMAGDTTTQVTITGRVRKGEKATLARTRADAAARLLRQHGVSAGRVRTATQAAATADGGAQLALTTSSPAALEASLNEQNPLSVQISQRVFAKGDNKVMDELLAKSPGTYNVQKDGRYYAVTIDKTLPAGPKTLAEARGQATSDYQTYLEKEWIAQLRAARPVKVNEAEVNKLITK
ncbi:MAG: peptidyl-prolyl cis-trans isomerase [Bacteroidota bacterium]|nr:peptidyl-prolyl cis-trans isomerase [Bacteroidota bacterium]